MSDDDTISDIEETSDAASLPAMESDGTVVDGVSDQANAEGRPAKSEASRKRAPKPSREWKEVQHAFMGCGRCSFFLAGYRVLHGQEAVNEASRTLDGGNLMLADDFATRQLLYKSYGWRVEEVADKFSGACPECRRTFDAADEDAPTLAVAVRPKWRPSK